MRKAAKEANRVADKVAQERMSLLKADPEFKDLCKLVPKVLRGKESGKDFETVTTDQEYVQRRNDGKVILLSKRDWDKYERFGRLCEKLAQKYKLHWVTVEDLAMGVKRPTVRPWLDRTITGGLDPVVFLPKDFTPGAKYVARSVVAPPLAAIEIMKRVKELDDKTKEEIKAYLLSLFKDIHGCRIVELSKAVEPPEKEKEGSKIELDVWLRVPTGYVATEVAEVYRRIDGHRRHVLANLGIPVPDRRRQSKLLMEAKPLRLLQEKANIGDIVDDMFPNGDLTQDRVLRKAALNRRSKGLMLKRKHLQQ